MYKDQRGIAHLLVLIAVIGLIIFFVIASIGPFKGNLSRLFGKPSSYASELSVPGSLKVEQDDQNAILSWDNYDTQGNGRPAGVSGYVVYYGEMNGSDIQNPQRKLTEDKIIQLQPLYEGKTYGAYVQAVNNAGEVSAPSQTITFKSDPTRVNTLRTQMNGFFDDFNQPAGPFNELLWNNAYSACIGADLGGQFINTQFHAHNQAFTSYCDRGKNVSRPRAVFDFTSGVQRPNGDSEYGTITFDMDGAAGRDQWYMDILDTANGLLDIPFRSDTVEDVEGHGQTPFNSVRILQRSGGEFNIYKIDEHGIEHNTIQTPGTVITAPIHSIIKNVRKHWVIKMSKDRIIVTIDGKLAGDVSGWRDAQGDHTNGLNLPFTKATMLWVQFTYNTPKADMPTSLLHWDNFGFDAPVGTTPTTVTHNYIDGNIGTKANSPCLPTTVCPSHNNDLIKIPDSVVGTTAQRLMFTIQSDYNWTSNDYILLNGTKYSMPDPFTLPQAKTLVNAKPIDSYTPFTVTIPVTNTQTGDNTLEFHLNAQILNVHLELDFPTDKAPSYTQPIDIWHYNIAPSKTGAGITEIPNHVSLNAVNGIDSTGKKVRWEVWNFPDYVLRTQDNGSAPANNQGEAGTGANNPIPQSGVLTIETSSSGGTALAGNGSYPGVQSYQIWIDRQKVDDQRTDAVVPAPGLNLSYQWDTTKYCNGPHQFYFVDYTPTGIPSQASATHANIQPGNYAPVTVYTSNPGNADCAIYRITGGNSASPIALDAHDNVYYPANFPGGTVLSSTDFNHDDTQEYTFMHEGNTSYTFKNIPNGSYDMIFKFAEVQWPPKNVGERVFNVSVNGQTVISNLDVIKEVGLRKPLDKKVTVQVSNGTIPVTFTGVVGDPIINAIEVAPAGTTPSPLEFKPTTTPTATMDPGHSMPSPGATTDPSIPTSLKITIPVNGSTVNTKDVEVTYMHTGNANHAHLQLDNQSEVVDSDFDGLYTFTNVSDGQHTIKGYLANADHSKIAGTDTQVSFTVSTQPVSTPSPTAQATIEPTSNPTAQPTSTPLPTQAPTPAATNAPSTGGGDNNSNNNTSDNGGGGGSNPTPSKQGDLNGDGKVNIFDMSILLRNWNKTGQGDLNSDGKVNIFDLSVMLRNWTKL